MLGWIIAGSILLVVIIGNHIRKRIRNKKYQDLRLEQHQQYLNSLKEKISIKDKQSPNIIIFFMDDMGFADISCYGAANIQTPHIDQLARTGVKFSTFYSSSPVCSPSRAGILTGRHPLRMHIPNVFFPSGSFSELLMKFFAPYAYGVKGLLPDEITLPEVLETVGYRTGMLGKWHLGDKSPHLPNDKGFQYFYGVHYSNDMKPYALWENKSVVEPAPLDQDHLTRNLTQAGVDFIKKNKDHPFFLHYCQPFPHHPLHASEKFRGSSQGGLYGDAVQEVDWSVGQILETLEELGIRDNTLIFFTSDNGPWHEGNPGYHRGRKGLPFEGGQRVPMIANWPGVIPAGVETNEMAMNTDLFPTILNLLEIPLPTDRILDGKDILPLLTQTEASSPHDFLYYHWGQKILAVRDKQFKYHTKHKSDNSSYHLLKIRPLLFDMENYDQESYDQMTHHPEAADPLKTNLEEFEDTLKTNPRGWIKKREQN